MECPICKSKAHVEIDTHSEGFAKNLQECGECGTLWTTKEEKAIILHTSSNNAA